MQLIVIEAGRRERHHWLDLWRYRELLPSARIARFGGSLQANRYRPASPTNRLSSARISI